MASERTLTFTPTGKSDEVSALLLRPTKAKALYVFAHGAGAGMRHEFMQDMAERLGKRGIATLRYQFPYTEAGRRRPDHAKLLEATVDAAVACGGKVAKGLPLFAGGKSMGGRMTSQWTAKNAPDSLRGLVFLGFPLHAPGRPGDARGAHLADVKLPMLFLQGDRDQLADLELLRPLCKKLGKRATLQIITAGDHTFKVRKKDGRDPEEVFDEVAQAVADWITARL